MSFIFLDFYFIVPKYFILLQHTARTFHNGDPASTVSHKDSGYFVLPVDRRPHTVDDILFENTNFTKSERIDCDSELMCGFPIYSSRWLNAV